MPSRIDGDPTELAVAEADDRLWAEIVPLDEYKRSVGGNNGGQNFRLLVGVLRTCGRTSAQHK
jgi:hypothetical protein